MCVSPGVGLVRLSAVPLTHMASWLGRCSPRVRVSGTCSLLRVSTSGSLGFAAWRPVCGCSGHRQAVSEAAAPSRAQQQRERGPVPPTLGARVLAGPSRFSRSAGVRCWPTASVCVFPVTDRLTHLFMSLSAIRVSPSGECLFNSFTCF